MEQSTKHRPLNILMTADTVGGVWSYALELCRALHPYDVHFHVVATGARLKDVQKQELELMKNITVYDKGFLLEWMESPWDSMEEAGAWLLELEDSVRPDLVHLNCFAYGSLAWKAPVLVVAHSDVWSWWLAVHKSYPPEEWNRYFDLVKNSLEDAAMIIAPSSTMMNYIRNIYNFTTPGNIIYNGRSACNFKPAEKKAFVFSMGRIWDEAKNTRLLMEASAKIPYAVKIAGDNSFEQNNFTAPEEAPISYLGKLTMPEVAETLSEASVYVLPARYEPFGLSVLEAALSGCALVLGNIDSLKELWADNALYVNTDDASALADAINLLMSDHALRDQYAGKAMKQASRYSSAAMAENYLHTYYGLLPQ